MFDHKGHLAEVLIVREENRVSIVRVTEFKSEFEAVMYEQRMLALVQAEFQGQGVPFEHNVVEVGNESQS